MERSIILFVLLATILVGQEPGPVKAPESTPESNKGAAGPKKKTMEEALKNTKEIPGLVTMYQDTTNGKLHMLIKKDQLDKEYIHFVHYLNGTVNAGVFKGW